MTYFKKNDLITELFRNYFSSLQFIQELPVSVSSDVDCSTFFVGSSTSVFKKHILSNNVCSRFIVQPCLRTQNLHHLYNDEDLPQWGSFFICLGCIVDSHKGKELGAQIIYFLSNILGIDNSNILCKVYYRDEDLIRISKDFVSEENMIICTDSMKDYRHTYGVNGLTGRNVNIFIKHESNQSKVVGNLILMEYDGLPICFEFGIGISTLLSAIENLHPVQCLPIADTFNMYNNYMIKLGDCITTSILLLREGIIPNSQRKGKILRKYIQGMSHLCRKTNISISELEDIIHKFELTTSSNESPLFYKKIGAYLNNYEDPPMSVKNINGYLCGFFRI